MSSASSIVSTFYIASKQRHTFILSHIHADKTMKGLHSLPLRLPTCMWLLTVVCNLVKWHARSHTTHKHTTMKSVENEWLRLKEFPKRCCNVIIKWHLPCWYQQHQQHHLKVEVHWWANPKVWSCTFQWKCCPQGTVSTECRWRYCCHEDVDDEQDWRHHCCYY